MNSNIPEFPTAKVCQHQGLNIQRQPLAVGNSWLLLFPHLYLLFFSSLWLALVYAMMILNLSMHTTAKGSQHYPNNPPVRLISPLPVQKPPERSPQWKLPAPIWMDLPPQNSSGRPKTSHIYSPPFQHPYLSAGPNTIEQQWQAQNSTQSTPTLP